MIVTGSARVEEWPLAEPFVISRSSRVVATVVALEITDGEHVGRGECQPNARYDEDPAAVAALLDGALAAEAGADGERLRRELPSAAARNALDCALWDLAAKREGRRVWELLGRAAPGAVETVFTISLGTPAAMAEAAARARASGKTLLKLKLGGAGDDERLRAVRAAVPDTRLVVDANEAWPEEELPALLRCAAAAGVAMVEQPLPAGRDEALRELARPLPICADESCHTAADVPELVGKYDLVNVKLDKTGGLTAALELERAARAAGLGLMVGCMLGTSLAMAPAHLLAAHARFADLDGPLLLAGDRDHGLIFTPDYRVLAPEAALWG